MSVEREDSRSMLMALAGCGLAGLLAVGTAVALIRHHADPELHMGDIIAFNRPMSEIPVAPVQAQLATGGTCMLDPSVLADRGGSLIVEGATEAASPLYRVHWAGPATAGKTEDCGHTAVLLMSEADLDTLSAVAGGYGVDEKSLALATPVPAMALAVN
jgi:hypothetical protein